MNPRFKQLTFAFAVVLIGATFTATANAACGTVDKPATLHRQSWDLGVLQPSLLNISDRDADPIVGMWHVTFTAKGNGSEGPPDGTPIDNAMVVWHPDGTEIMNSNRPAQDGNFCLGVWEKTGRNTYKLVHIPWQGNDTENAPTGIGNPQGAVQIAEQITLGDCDHYSGRFTLDAYDPSGNNVAHIVGVIKATRVTVNTKVKDLL